MTTLSLSPKDWQLDLLAQPTLIHISLLLSTFTTYIFYWSRFTPRHMYNTRCIISLGAKSPPYA